MKKSKKYSISLLVILISVPIFAANLNPVSGQDDVELSIIVTGQQAPAVEGVINDFLSSDLGDGVSGVTVVTSGERAEDQLSYLINLMNSEDDEFDVLGLDVIWPAQFAENGWIEELSSSDYGVTSDEMNDYFSGMVQASTYDGKIWAYPYFLNLGVLFYRKDILARNGFSVEDIGTWEGFNATLNTILANETEMDNNPNLVGHVGQFDAYEGGVCNFMEWIGSGGQIEILDDEGNANITTDKNQESMEFLSGLIQPRFQNLSATDAVIPRTALTMDEGSSNSVWLAGNAICMRQWPFAYDLTKATNDLNATDGSGNYTQFGITRMPIKSGATNAKSSVVGGAVLSVSTYSNNKQEAFNLIRYLGDQDAQEYELTSTANFPALKSVFSNPPSGYEWITDFASAAQSTLSRPVHPKYSQMSTQIADGFSSLLSGAKNVSTSLAEMEEDVNEIIAGGATETGGIPGYPVGLIAVASLFSIGIMVAIMKKKH